ncbi:SAC3/GANP/Nin1/mts3/eIF-3 p25 family-domain-containing protein [Corynascus novoguineensis]|uniref:SAC3/GANP/Nin1/mts3/eIF-3 p25 family-domain-containing protein n=1 Tax=Corynascus novoguineensis TaxID=1126955 RepID=A0AAN7CME0_9PEZI|nr:SAC3/GANP/Nin1/mts3/eIF-3 p25 family-domain-containing protein [Corynascus novoguineensis]
MADRELAQLVTRLKTNPPTSYPETAALLSRAKLLLLKLDALTPPSSSSSPRPALLALARDTYEQGALASIRARDPAAFTRYVSQLRPFYELLPAHEGEDERNKIIGLYLLLLLTQGLYGEFHSELEALSMTTAAAGGGVDVEGDRYLGYPIRLERWLMEGSYDRVWKAMKKGEVPCEEFGVFSEILTSQIRSEIASSSERAYPSLPLSSTKSLLFLDSEGAVVEFARSRGWTVKDGQIFFPSAQETGEEEQEKEMSQMVIENTLGYARQLETIV